MADWNSHQSGAESWDAGGDSWTGSGDVRNSFADGFDNNGTEADTAFGEAGGFGDQAAGGACHNCGQEGHFSRECNEPRKMGACFNCGEEGHSKAECTKPRVFTGECRECNEKGHRANDCPNKPKFCKQCMAEGHDTTECQSKTMVVDMTTVPDCTEPECWNKIHEASDEGDIDDFNDALKMLQKTNPALTYPAIEKRLRKDKTRFYLIALKKEIGAGYTNVDLAGGINKTYVMSVYKSPTCPRPNMAETWPNDPEDNLERLNDAGVTMDRGLPFCRICDKVGHATRSCDQEKMVVEGAQIYCYLCESVGHRVRDCPEERHKPREPRACKICEKEDHIAKDCPDKKVFTCRNCGSEDHKAAECDQPRKMICNNCNEEGHMGRECPQPRDWSKVTCRFCGEKGHASQTRCAPGAKKEDDPAQGLDDFGGSSENNTNDFGSTGFNDGNHDQFGSPAPIQGNW